MTWAQVNIYFMSNFGLYMIYVSVLIRTWMSARSFCSQWISEVPSTKEQRTEKNIMETYTYKEW